MFKDENIFTSKPIGDYFFLVLECQHSLIPQKSTFFNSFFLFFVIFHYFLPTQVQTSLFSIGFEFNEFDFAFPVWSIFVVIFSFWLKCVWKKKSMRGKLQQKLKKDMLFQTLIFWKLYYFKWRGWLIFIFSLDWIWFLIGFTFLTKNLKKQKKKMKKWKNN